MAGWKSKLLMIGGVLCSIGGYFVQREENKEEIAELTEETVNRQVDERLAEIYGLKTETQKEEEA